MIVISLIKLMPDTTEDLSVHLFVTARWSFNEPLAGEEPGDRPTAVSTDR